MSRVEDMLTAIADGNPITDEPICRREQFLQAIANNDGSANLPDPICREEMLLKQIAENGTGGGSGTITTEDIIVTPKTTQQTISRSSGKYINKVTVNPVTSSIDNNIQSENIKKDVTILGVTGTLENGGGSTLDYDQASGVWYAASYDDSGKVESIMYYVFPLLQDENGKRNVKVYSADAEGFYDSTTPGMTYRIDGNQIKLEMESEGEINDAGSFDYEVIDNKVHLTMEGEVVFTKIVTGLGVNDNGNFVSSNITQNGLYNGVTLNDPEALYFSAVIDVSGSSGGGSADMMQQRVDADNSCINLFSNYRGYNVDYISNLDTSSVTNMSNMFNNSMYITTIPQLDTSSVTNMSGMFSYCAKLTEIPQLDTSNVTNMFNMFQNCKALTTIPQLDTSSATNMSSMFGYCANLTTIPQLDTSSATNMSSMFSDCTNLTAIPQLDTSSATNMSNMFQNCKALTIIPQLDTSSVTNMSAMFINCAKLTTITQLDTSSVTSISNMFNNCTNLTNLTLKNIKRSITIGSGTTYGHLLTVDSLVNTIKELWAYTSGSYKLTMGSTNTAKLADVYVKLIDVTDEMIAQDPNIESKMPCEVCESTDEGAMLITTYVSEKGWTIA